MGKPSKECPPLFFGSLAYLEEMSGHTRLLLWQTCKVFHPWALFHEITVYAVMIGFIHLNQKRCLLNSKLHPANGNCKLLLTWFFTCKSPLWTPSFAWAYLTVASIVFFNFVDIYKQVQVQNWNNDHNIILDRFSASIYKCFCRVTHSILIFWQISFFF